VTPRVLFLSYYFPPIGGAGGQRNPRLVRYLPELGYEPVVITGPGAPVYRWSPLDPSLEVSGVEVHRLPGPEPAKAVGWARRAERLLRRTSAWRRWWSEEVPKLARQVGDVDLVHASIAPYETAETAVVVARALKKPLVVDFEDPWALDEMMVYPSRLHRALEFRRMLRLLRAADTIVMNTPEAARRVRELVPGKTVAVVSNGYDPADFERPTPPREDGGFRIVHTGSLQTDLGLAHRRTSRVRSVVGGALGEVDFLPRSHVFLLDALKQLEGELRAPIELHLAGNLTAADEAALEGAPVRVVRHGFLEHPDTIALIRSADLLFLPMHEVAEGKRVGIVPCKTYEYLASGNPILAAVPDGDARDLLARSGAALICRPRDVDGMARAVARELRRWRARITGPAATTKARVFEYEALTADLAAVYDGVLPRSPEDVRERVPALASG
jgi:glycosyltransferase involved in cell wall biosynthesis